ncbi:MAG: hypothetical protein V3575_04925 [Candidatus Absconditabacteria bacterium]
MKIGNLRKDRLHRVKRCFVAMFVIILIAGFCGFGTFMRMPDYTIITMFAVFGLFGINEGLKLDKFTYGKGLEALKTLKFAELERDSKILIGYIIFSVIFTSIGFLW